MFMTQAHKQPQDWFSWLILFFLLSPKCQYQYFLIIDTLKFLTSF